MKLSKRLCWIACGIFMLAGILLFVNDKYYFQVEDKAVIMTQNKSVVLQEANRLYLQARKTNDDNLIHQAIDKLSVWFEKNKNNPNKKLVAEILRTRGNNFIEINEMNKAISDYKESIEYDPIAQMQSVVCSLEEKQGKLSDLSALHACYTKAVELFIKNQVLRSNVDFLFARIWSGDQTAIIDYRNFYKLSSGREKKIYEMMAEGFFDRKTYKEVIGKDCQDCSY